MRIYGQAGLILIGGLLLLNSVFLALRTNFNIGVILPAVLGMPLFLAGFFLDKLLTGQGIWIWLRSGLIGGYLLLLIVLLISAGLQIRQLRREPNPQAEAIVVLGAAVRGDRVSATLASRLDAALGFWQQHPQMTLVVCGGQGPDEDISEAEAMALYFEARNVPAAQILHEDQSTNTRENLRFARQHLLEQPGIDPLTADRDPVIVVVTSNYHVFRAVLTARDSGLEASGLGAPTLWFLLPGDFLRETLALTYHFLTGGL